MLTFPCSPADGTVNGYAVIQVIKLGWPLIGILRKTNHLYIFLIYGHSPVLFTAYLLLSTEVSSVDFYHYLRASKVAQWVKNLPAKQETLKTHVQSLGLENPGRRKWQLPPVFCLENPMERGAWWAIVHSVI